MTRIYLFFVNEKMLEQFLSTLKKCVGMFIRSHTCHVRAISLKITPPIAMKIRRTCKSKYFIFGHIVVYILYFPEPIYFCKLDGNKLRRTYLSIKYRKRNHTSLRSRRNENVAQKCNWRHPRQIPPHNKSSPFYPLYTLVATNLDTKIFLVIGHTHSFIKASTLIRCMSPVILNN